MRFKFLATSGTHNFPYGSLILLQLPLHLPVLILKGKNTSSFLLTLTICGLTVHSWLLHEIQFNRAALKGAALYRATQNGAGLNRAALDVAALKGATLNKVTFNRAASDKLLPKNITALKKKLFDKLKDFIILCHYLSLNNCECLKYHQLQ